MLPELLQAPTCSLVAIVGRNIVAVEACGLCHRTLDYPADPLSEDCGGDIEVWLARDGEEQIREDDGA